VDTHTTPHLSVKPPVHLHTKNPGVEHKVLGNAVEVIVPV
jgi:hypothetical protein